MYDHAGPPAFAPFVSFSFISFLHLSRPFFSLALNPPWLRAMRCSRKGNTRQLSMHTLVEWSLIPRLICWPRIAPWPSSS